MRNDETLNFNNLPPCHYTNDNRKNAEVLLISCKDIGLAVNTGKTIYLEIVRHRDMIA